MATAINTVTKTASVVKTTKGSEKKWSEILSMNRRHDLQLPLDIAKYDHGLKRTYNAYLRQKYQTERLWANKHETWYQDDFLFRNHLLKQLKPITRRFKNIDSLALEDSQDHQQQQRQSQVLSDDELQFLDTATVVTTTTTDKKEKLSKELSPLKYAKKRSTIRHFQNYSGEDIPPNNPVLSKLMCPKVLNEYEPRLYSHSHAPFLDVAQRFLNRKPESLEKRVDNKEKQQRQKEYVKVLINTEQERTRLAAAKFQKQLEEDKNKDNNYTDFDDNNSYYTRPF